MMPEQETPEPSSGSDVSGLAYLALRAEISPHEQPQEGSTKVQKLHRGAEGFTFVFHLLCHLPDFL
jgi:hypothetical protein